jgi:hypothetical protein
MFTLLLVILFAIAVFLISFIAPKKGTAIQRLTLKISDAVSNYASNKPKLIRILLGNSSKISHKAIHKTAHGGKKTKKAVKQISETKPD